MSRKLFVTSALPYANGPLHIGHIMEYIQVDIWVRFQRMLGSQVHFVGADDAHGAPIMLKAEGEGITPQELVRRIAAGRPQYLDGFHISFDHWYSTDSPENTALSQDIYRRLQAAGLIYVRPVEQFFDPVKNMFLADRYIKGECPHCHAQDQYADACESCSTVNAPTELINPKSTLSGVTPVLKSSDHLFFRLSDPRCVQFLQQWLTAPGHLQPQVSNKAREWLAGGGEASQDRPRDGLADWDISRDAPYFGIPIPDHPGKFFYVWLDAPVGYLASLKNYFTSGKAAARGETRGFEEFLAAPDTEQVHFIGKDIIYFHTLFWPAMLKFAGLKVPDNIHVHGFLTVLGSKMSKSRGTGIDPLRYLSIGMNPEWLRYYIAAKLNSNVEDVDFNPEDFTARVNSDLVGKYVNIASRCANFITRQFGGELTDISAADASGRELLAAFGRDASAIRQAYEERDTGAALRQSMALADLANRYVADKAPWDISKDPARKAELQVVCSVALNVFRWLTILLQPVVPALAQNAAKFLNVPPLAWSDLDAPLPAGHRINTYEHLMTRADPKQLEALFDAGSTTVPTPAGATTDSSKKPAAKRPGDSKDTAMTAPTTILAAPPAAAPQTANADATSGVIGIDDFARLDLRIGKVTACELVEGSDKLLRFELDAGPLGKRQIFSGIRAAYAEPGKLVGRNVVFIANLAPRKMRFGLSEGMILSAGDGGTDLFLLDADPGARPGATVR